MNQYDIPGYLIIEMPEIKESLRTILSPLNLIKTIQNLADYTRSKLVQHDFLKATRCFEIAENIYIEGDKAVKDTIENVFVYTLPSLLNLCNKEEERKIEALIPFLHKAYVKQIFSSGI
jgi:hypothetical protein